MEGHPAHDRARAASVASEISRVVIAERERTTRSWEAHHYARELAAGRFVLRNDFVRCRRKATAGDISHGSCGPIPSSSHCFPPSATNPSKAGTSVLFLASNSGRPIDAGPMHRQMRKWITALEILRRGARIDSTCRLLRPQSVEGEKCRMRV